MATNQAIAFAMPHEFLDRDFLFYYLLSQRHELDGAGKGATQRNIGQAILKAWPVCYPSLPQQRRIVAILDEHISDLDDGMRSLRKADARCRLLKRGVLLDLIPEPADWPTRWRSETVSAVGSVELGRQRHPDWHHGSNMHPYLRVANVFEDRIDTSDVMEMHWPEDTFERFKLRPGQILLNEGQSPQYLGRPAMYRGDPADVAFTNSLLRFTAGPDALPEFALLVFRRHMHAGRFAKESRITTNIAHLSASRLKGVEFPVPSLAEQKDLVNLARERLGAVSRIEGSIQAQMRRADGLRRAVLAAAFSGRLSGHSSDTNVIEELAEEESA
jgi:type I restriction enzyme S subunit